MNLPELVIYVSIYFKFTGDLLNVMDLLPTKFRGHRLIFFHEILADKFIDHTVFFLINLRDKNYRLSLELVELLGT